MITSYPDKNALKEVFATGMSATTLKNICKENGVFILSMDKDQIINDAHLFYWGYKDINKISNIIEDEKNYKKSFRLKISHNNQLDIETNSFTEFYNRMIAYRNSMSNQDGIKFESLRLLNDEKSESRNLIGDISYKKRRPGRVELLSETKQKFNFQISEREDNEIIIDFIFNDRSDIAVAKKMITNAISTLEDYDLPIQISLKSLTTEERVDLFDKFFSYKFEHWRLDSIRNIKVKKNTDEELDSEEEEIVQNSILTGIESALLTGFGLRNNQIVVNAVDKGYFFPKATVMFEHRYAAQKVLIDVSFSTEELLLEIMVVGTYEIEENRDLKTPISETEQAAILCEFHDVIQDIYLKIVSSRVADTK